MSPFWKRASGAEGRWFESSRAHERYAWKQAVILMRRGFHWSPSRYLNRRWCPISGYWTGTRNVADEHTEPVPLPLIGTHHV
jgi:hypothetical protein